MKRSKKFYGWKLKYILKKRAIRPFGSSAPKQFRQCYHFSDRMLNRTLIQHLKNVEYDDSKLSFPGRHRHSANWDFW